MTAGQFGTGNKPAMAPTAHKPGAPAPVAPAPPKSRDYTIVISAAAYADVGIRDSADRLEHSIWTFQEQVKLRDSAGG